MTKSGQRRGHRGHPIPSYRRYYNKIQLFEPVNQLQLSTLSIAVLDSMMDEIFHRLATTASQLSKIREKKTLTARDIEYATRLVLPAGKLSQIAILCGKKAVKRFKNSYTKNPVMRHSSGSSGSNNSLLYSKFSSNVQHHSSMLVSVVSMASPTTRRNFSSSSSSSF